MVQWGSVNSLALSCLAQRCPVWRGEVNSLVWYGKALWSVALQGKVQSCEEQLSTQLISPGAPRRRRSHLHSRFDYFRY